MSVLWFEQVDAGAVAIVGGKGANLGEMCRAGFPVPPGFCVTSRAYRHFVESAGIWPAMAALLQSIAPDETVGLEAAAAQIRALLEQPPMPAEVAEAVCAAYRKLEGGGVPVAVRSSATAEDLPAASFAGQQESYLNIRGEADLLIHVQRCWASLWTARAISYRERNGFDHSQVSLAVIVQVMIDPDTAGVLFTVNPVTGSRDEMLVNAAYGLGESVVSGRVTPDSYRLSRHSPPQLIEQTIGAKEIAIRFQSGGGTVAVSVPQADRDRHCLTPRDLQSLLSLGTQVETHYQAPQDIEWGIAAGRLYLLQTRPITSLGRLPPDRRRFSRLEKRILDDILEHYPDPPYPLDYQSVTDGYEQLQQMLREAGLHLPPAHTIIRMDEQGISTLSPAAPRPTWRLLRFPCFIRRKLSLDPGAWAMNQGAHIAERLTKLREADLTALSNLALADQIEAATGLATEIGHLRFTEYIGPMMIRGGLIRLLVRLGGGRLQGEAELLGALSYKSLEIDHALHRLAAAALAVPAVSAAIISLPPTEVGPTLQTTPQGNAFLAELAAFLREHGARTMKVYLPFSNLSWTEDPSTLWATLAAIMRAGNPAAVEARVQASRGRFTALRDRVANRLPGPFRRCFLEHLERFRAGHLAREATLYAIEESFLIARLAVREAGRRLEVTRALAQPGDLLYLTLPELTGILRNRAEISAGAQRNAAPPDYYRQMVLSRRRDRSRAATVWRGSVPTLRKDAGDLKGLAASPGIATGRVKVISGPAEFGKLQPGEILVCSFTDPAWTPLFTLAAGVISDTGGPLSHAAIVAREYGIPAVLGTQSATKQLSDGEIVMVDGYSGSVILKPNG